MRFRRAVLIATTLSMSSFGVPPANATVFTGVCAMSVAISFHSPVGAVPRSVSYDIGGGPARTVNQVTDGCVVDSDGASFLRSTSASGDGFAQEASCGALVGQGSWEQNWETDPPPMSGNHSITGTWGHWTMVVTSPSLNFTGEMELTVDPLDAAKLSQCTSNGISGIRMIGVMHFQDPVL